MQEKVTGVAHVDMTLSVPKSVSVLWAMSNEPDRQAIERLVPFAGRLVVAASAQEPAHQQRPPRARRDRPRLLQ